MQPALWWPWLDSPFNPPQNRILQICPTRLHGYVGNYCIILSSSSSDCPLNAAYLWTQLVHVIPQFTRRVEWGPCASLLFDLLLVEGKISRSGKGVYANGVNYRNIRGIPSPVFCLCSYILSRKKIACSTSLPWGWSRPTGSLNRIQTPLTKQNEVCTSRKAQLSWDNFN